MELNFARALRLSATPRIAFVGSGGKTTALFHLAHQLASPVIVTTSTHIHPSQAKLSDSHCILQPSDNLSFLSAQVPGVILITGPQEQDRLTAPSESQLQQIYQACHDLSIPLLVEADGARMLPLKAPGDHEPAIPPFIDLVVVVAGLSGLGKPLTKEYIHRPEIFSKISGLPIGSQVTAQALAMVLCSPLGGLKNIPSGAARTFILNQADTSEMQGIVEGLAAHLLGYYDSVIISSNVSKGSGEAPKFTIHSRHAPKAIIILAAGNSTRFGSSKQLIKIKGRSLIRLVTETALQARPEHVIVVLGADSEQIRAEVSDLPIKLVVNSNWSQGQSSSIHAGIRALPPRVDAVIFMLADQPQVTPSLIEALIERHNETLDPIIAPTVSGLRANPVLFDRDTFPSLLALTGDVGGRAIFSRYRVSLMPWHDLGILTEIDTPGDYQNWLTHEP